MESSMERQRVLATSSKLGTPYEKKLKVASATPRYDPVNTMLACEWHGKEDIRVVERPRPMITEPGDALVKITSTAICGSDLHMYFNQVPGPSVLHSGDVLGHECMGIIEKVGPEVRNLKAGDRVVVSAVIADGTCNFCQRQEYSLCDGTNPSSTLDAIYGDRTAGIFGYTHLCGGFDGGQAEYIRVPLADMNCLPVPETLSDEKVLFLSDIICTGWHGNELAEVKKGDVVAIWGCGPVGLMAAKLALYRGATKVYAIDHIAHRLEIARSIGAEPIDFTTIDPVDFLLKALPNGPDACIDCAGFRFPTTLTHKVMSTLKLETDSLDIVSQMVKCCRKGGTIALIGDYFGVGNGFPIGAFMEKGITMRGSQVFVQKYWKHLLSLIEAGEFDPTFVITHRMPLKQLSEAYNIFGHAKDDVIKIVLKPEQSTTSVTGK